MKTKLIIAVIASLAIISFGASRINKDSNKTQSAIQAESTASIGGLGSEDK